MPENKKPTLNEALKAHEKMYGNLDLWEVMPRVQNFQGADESDVDFGSRLSDEIDYIRSEPENQKALQKAYGLDKIKGLPQTRALKQAAHIGSQLLPMAVPGVGPTTRALTGLIGLAGAIPQTGLLRDMGWNVGKENPPDFLSKENLSGLSGLLIPSLARNGSFLARHPGVAGALEPFVTSGANWAINKEKPDYGDALGVGIGGLGGFMAGRLSSKISQAPSTEHQATTEALGSTDTMADLQDIPNRIKVVNTKKRGPDGKFTGGVQTSYKDASGAFLKPESVKRAYQIAQSKQLFDEDMNTLVSLTSKNSHKIPPLIQRTQENLKTMRRLGFSDKEIQGRFMEYLTNNFFVKRGMLTQPGRNQSLFQLTQQPHFKDLADDIFGAGGAKKLEGFSESLNEVQKALSKEGNPFHIRMFEGGSTLGKVIGISIGGVEALISPTGLAERIASGRLSPKGEQMKKLVDFIKEGSKNPTRAIQNQRDAQRQVLNILFPGTPVMDSSVEEGIKRTKEAEESGIIGQ